MNKMEYTLDTKIKSMLGNLDLIPEMIDPKAFSFFGDSLLSRRTAKVYQLLCNISKYHETSADAINWLCMNLGIKTDINIMKLEPITEIFPNLKEYIWSAEADEETGAFFIFESKFEETEFLEKCSRIKKYTDLLIIAKYYNFDIYQVAELLAASFYNCNFFMDQRGSEFERPILGAIIYAKLVSNGIIKAELIKNHNPDNNE